MLSRSRMRSDIEVMWQAILLLLTVSLHSTAWGKSASSCSDLTELIKTTYNFRPALVSDAERAKKSDAMDKVWDMVKANKNDLVPCLRKALDDPNADQWFKFDGSNLLVLVDPSPDSKKLQVKNYTLVNLEDVDLRVWVRTLVARGLEDFDTSEAARRWLSYPKAGYFLPEHGAYQVNSATGALFLFGSLDEGLATPALMTIVNQSDHPRREVALAILLYQNTPESLRFLRQLDLSKFPAKTQKLVRQELTRPDLFEPRSKPKTSRKEFLDAFEALVKGDVRPFFQLVDQVPDGEKDVVATLTADDLPLLRKVRRRMIAGGNPHSIEYYNSFTKIIKTMLRKNESSS